MKQVSSIFRHLFHFYEEFMNQTQNTDSLVRIIKQLTSELTTILTEHSAYGESFPKGSVLGFSDANDTDKKELAKKYYLYASALAGAVSRMEDTISGISAVIIDADKKHLYARILFCDKLLLSYGELKKAISSFAAQNERIISKDSLSISEMLRIHSELGYKLSYFRDFLNEYFS